ncbi:perilipin-3-like isoform X1 [Monodelphis domestica]|uniref:perilipin-3-like isoform X1 n=2 Tax=Monodelphis domestica TaxID=13616 RepID=UPI0024E273E5|nr:perilipin-3-like isoform X1 [Monodelphis domestica]XP_007498097.2 perilipin-3-like isoform X1 [Monodelphis domestica]
MSRYNLSPGSTKEIMVKASLGKNSWYMGTKKGSSKLNKTVSSMILDDAKQIVAELSSKSANEPINQEKMSTSQVPKETPHSSIIIVVDQTLPSKETELVMNTTSNDLDKEDANTETADTRTEVDDATPKPVSEEEKTMSEEEKTMSEEEKPMSEEERILSEIQEEKKILEELKVSLDKCLPISQNLVGVQESSEEDECFGEDYSRDDSFFTTLGCLPVHLQPQAYKNALEIIRGAKYDIRELLYQLYETIELTYQSKQGSENRQISQKALFELWIKWSRNQSENADDSQLLESRTLVMSRNITMKLQSAFMDLMPKIQGLPSSLQDRLQQAYCDMRELHTTFSMSNRFEDLERYQLAQSQFKLTQAQGSIEQLLCFLESNVPSGWVVGPLCPSDLPKKDVVTPKNS